jgi:hypothetical protein
MSLQVFARQVPLRLALLLAAALPGVTQTSAGANDRILVGDFEQRARAYLDFRQRLSGKGASASDSPDAILARQRELGQKIRRARRGAKQGDIFRPPIAAYFRRQLASTLGGPEGEKILASLRHAEPVKLDLGVNESYPERVPLQSTPPSLLLRLPALPQGLEYRILDRELVLRDRDANLIVDYIPDAFGPEMQK